MYTPAPTRPRPNNRAVDGSGTGGHWLSGGEVTKVRSSCRFVVQLGEFTPDQATLDCALGAEATVKVPEKSEVYDDAVTGGPLAKTAAF